MVIKIPVKEWTKKNTVNIFIAMAFVLIFTVVVSAQATFQEGDFTDGFRIRSGVDDLITKNNNYTLNFHVYNETNGYPMTSGVICYLHLYDFYGNNIYASSDNSTSDSFDYSFFVEGGNFTNTGSYSYVAQCNSSISGGFVSGGIDVTYSGKEMSSANSIFYIVLFFLFVFLFAITILGINALPKSNEKDEQGKIMNISHLKYLRPILWMTLWMFVVAILFMMSNVAFAYLPDTLFADFFFALFIISLGLTLPIVVLWFLWIFSRIIDDKETRKMWEKGMFPQGKL